MTTKAIGPSCATATTGTRRATGCSWCAWRRSSPRISTLNQLASLGGGHRAERSAPTDSWIIVDESEEFIRHHVATTGWAVEYVTAGGDDAPAFAYTVGLYRNFGHPEIILFGLQPDVAQGVLNNCGHRAAGGATMHSIRRSAMSSTNTRCGFAP